tara:strand:- start:65 stop:607 length:543 start_codon:yes stop_codon:yes gene_type:complete
MEYDQQMQTGRADAKLAFYQNPGYQFERRKKQNLVIDYKISKTITYINLPLFEPLIIDKLSDVYIETFTTYDAYPGPNQERLAFVVDIKEFNINTTTNRYRKLSPFALTNSFNKIVIPNADDGAGFTRTKTHKGRKLNQVCTLNPSTISNLTIKITDLEGKTMFRENGRIIFEFVIVERD